MEWTRPRHQRPAVNAAGRVLLVGQTDPAYEQSLDIINNWRSAHAFPLNTFQMGLRDKAKKVAHKSLVAQRIKRLSSIEQKLELIPTLKLSAMQDIGGCRAVLPSVSNVRQLVKTYKRSGFKHRLVREDDYISTPRDTGYRGVHLVYRYYSDRNETYNDLKIEMQNRTQIQHVWATAVETVGTFTSQTLKSNQGGQDWLRFFALMGTAIALREKCSAVPGTPSTRKELAEELRELTARLDVNQRLSAYGKTLHTIKTNPSLKRARYFLLSLDTVAHRLTITGYQQGGLEQASATYLATERENILRPGTDAVLVSADTIAALNRAYPNYFADTTVFLAEVRRAIK